MMNSGLDKQVADQIRGVLARHPSVEKAVLYGSRAMNRHKPGSDIDLNLQGEDIGPEERDRILLEFDELNLPHAIDVTALSQISNHELIDHIGRVGLVVYRREE
jgi:predicted nucleotidyltransferase